MKRSNGMKPKKYPSFYAWICGEYNSFNICKRKLILNDIINFDKELDTVFQSRKNKKKIDYSKL